MAKLTIAQLKNFVTAYVTSAKQAGAWNNTTDNIFGLIDKIGKVITLDGGFEDKLANMEGDALELGKTIEEYFIDLTLPTAFDNTGATNDAPAYPAVEDVVYSYTLGRKKIKTTTPYGDLERAALTEAGAISYITNIVKRLYDSYSVARYAVKKQVLANVISKAESASHASGLVEVLTTPTNEATSKAFIKAVKNDVETASFANEGHALTNTLIGSAPSLTLYIKKGIMPAVEVEALAGAFQSDKLAIPAKVVKVDDFGDNASGVYAMLVDERGQKLHTGYKAIRTHENADGDFMNYVLHYEDTAFISKFTFVKVYKGA